MSVSEKKIKILIVDDLTLIRAALRSMLSEVEDLEVVGEADDGKKAINLIRESEPHIVLLDLKMPDSDGLETAQKILRIAPKVKILILTAHTDNVYPSRLLDIGVSGYVTKDSSMDELVKAIHKINAGERYISPHIAQNLIFDSLSEDKDKVFDELTDRELQVASMITRGQSSSEISEKLNLSAKTVNSYRYRIFEKLGVKGDVELTLLAIRHGLITVMTPPPAEAAAAA